MTDQYGRVTRLLDNMRLPERWLVVEPVSGDLRNIIWIQNEEKGLAPAESDDLDDEEIIKRIRAAISKPTARPTRG